MAPSQRTSRVPGLIDDFGRYIEVYLRDPPFRAPGQLDVHLQTIRMRRELGSAARAIDDDAFLKSLYEVLKEWRMGQRSSVLIPERQFIARLREKKAEICAYDGISIDDPALDAPAMAQRLWATIASLDITPNKSKIVAGTKTLHHILPDLVVPIDRGWTKQFFGWQSRFDGHQKACFLEAWCAFVEVARGANPAQYVRPGGWSSSRTKVIDNALIGMLRDEEAGGHLPNLSLRIVRAAARAPARPASISKYQPLALHLRSMPKATRVVTLSFSQLEAILGAPLPPSAMTHRPWWANQRAAQRRPQARAWLSAGFRVDQVNPGSTGGSVRFVRT